MDNKNKRKFITWNAPEFVPEVFFKKFQDAEDDFKPLLLHQDEEPTEEFAPFSVVKNQNLYPIIKTYMENFDRIDGQRGCRDLLRKSYVSSVSKVSKYHKSSQLLLLDSAKRFRLSLGKCLQLLPVLNIIANLFKYRLYMLTRTLKYCLPDFRGSAKTLVYSTHEIAMMLKCPRDDLRLHGTSKGWVAGHVKFTFKNESYNCFERPWTRFPIPSQVDCVTFCENVRPSFILYVEKECVLLWLVELKFHIHFKCILVTGCGHPSFATKEFVHKLIAHFKMPLYVFVDSNLGGLRIIFTLLCGSQKTAYHNQTLTVKDIRWIGLKPSQIIRLGIVDFVKGKKMSISKQEDLVKFMALPEIKARPNWLKEIRLMHDIKTDFDIECLHAISLKYLTDFFLPYILQEGRWDEFDDTLLVRVPRSDALYEGAIRAREQDKVYEDYFEAGEQGYKRNFKADDDDDGLYPGKVKAEDVKVKTEV